MIRYVFKDVSPLQNFKDADPQQIGEEIQAIADQNAGRIEPEMLVERAADPNSALHRHIEWRDDVAARHYRIDQARQILQCIHVIDEAASEGHIRAFVNLSDNGGRAYRPLSVVRQSLSLSLQVLESAERDLQLFKRRYASLTEVLDIVAMAEEKIREARAHAGRPRPEIPN